MIEDEDFLVALVMLSLITLLYYVAPYLIQH